MFEKYSEKGSRAIFFSRREAGKSGATAIDSAHLLLGVLREDEARLKHLTGMPNLSSMARARLEATSKKQFRVLESFDMPIANEYKEVLLHAADEAGMLSRAKIEPEHLLLAILRLKECVAANLLASIGLTYDVLRKAVGDESPE